MIMMVLTVMMMMMVMMIMMMVMMIMMMVMNMMVMMMAIFILMMTDDIAAVGDLPADDDDGDDDDDSRTVLSDPNCAVLSDPNPVVPSDPATQLICVCIYILYLHWDNSNLWLHLSRRKDLNRAMSESRWISLSLKCYGFSHITKHTTPSVRFTALMGCFLMMFAEKKALPSAQHAKHLYRLACSAWAQMSKRHQFKWMIVTCT